MHENNNHVERVDLQISGMHCASCEVLIERKFKQIAGVERVRVNNATGRAKVYCTRIPSLEEFNGKVHADGYSVVLRRTENAAPEQSKEPNGRHYGEIAGIAAIVIGIFLALKQFNIAVPNLGVADSMSYGFVFVLGLVAAVSTCIAVTGGLLIGVAARYSERHPELSGIQKFKPHLYFNLGRVLSYAILGGAVGALGSLITLSTRATGIVTVVASLVMVILGVQMLHIFPWLKRFQFKMPKRFAHHIHDVGSSDHRAAPFFLGAATFFLPCGFTQALQLYVLSQGGAVRGGLTMLIFALGTLPALLSLSAITSFAKGIFQQYFVKVAGVTVVLLGLLNVNNGLALAGVRFDPATLLSGRTSGETGEAAVITNGVQVADMRVVGYEYYPSQFSVKAGVPVEWRIDGTKAQGCAQVITVPKLRITKRLSRSGLTTISFTPKEAGTLEFSCTMGMTTPNAKFRVLADARGAVRPNYPEPQIPGEEPVDISKCNPKYAMCL